MGNFFSNVPKLLLGALVTSVVIAAGLANSVQGKEITPVKTTDKVAVFVFVRQGCTHCQEEENFLNKLGKNRNDFSVKYYRLQNPSDRTVWETFTQRVESAKVTPITVIGDTYFVGFDKPETSGKDIVRLIDTSREKKIKTNLATIDKNNSLGASSTCDAEGLVPCSVNPSFFVNLPILGRIDAQQYPLMIISAMFGFFDGFNPCAMWVLISFLIILIQVGNKRKMFLFAGIFILAEAIMYSLILVVWYKTWDFVRLDTFITPLVGIVSIVGGVFFLKEWQKKELECRVTDYKQKKQIREKIISLASNKFTLASFFAILGIAFSVNVIEFACSIGIPQAFTKILELNKLGGFQTVLYIAIYILFYMIDDLIVFGIALYSIDKLAITTKYSKISNLLGGIVMILLGLVMIFKPNLILF